MNINKRIKQVHKQLDVHLEELILQDCEYIGDMYFKQYQYAIDKIQEMIDELYTHAKIDEKDYEQYVYGFMDVVEEIRGSNRIVFISDMLNELNNKNSSRYSQLIIDFLIRELARLGVDRSRISIEIQKANYRFIRNMRRFHDLKIEETEQELIAVVMFAQESLLEYGRKRVNGFYDEEIEVELEEVDCEESNQYIKITALDDMIDFVESYGYKRIRQCGSHAIYRNERGVIVVVPIHSGNRISKDLAYGIQKQIINNVS